MSTAASVPRVSIGVRACIGVTVRRGVLIALSSFTVGATPASAGVRTIAVPRSEAVRGAPVLTASGTAWWLQGSNVGPLRLMRLGPMDTVPHAVVQTPALHIHDDLDLRAEYGLSASDERYAISRYVARCDPVALCTDGTAPRVLIRDLLIGSPGSRPTRRPAACAALVAGAATATRPCSDGPAPVTIDPPGSMIPDADLLLGFDGRFLLTSRDLVSRTELTVLDVATGAAVSRVSVAAIGGARLGPDGSLVYVTDATGRAHLIVVPPAGAPEDHGDIGPATSTLWGVAGGRALVAGNGVHVVSLADGSTQAVPDLTGGGVYEGVGFDGHQIAMTGEQCVGETITVRAVDEPLPAAFLGRCPHARLDGPVARHGQRFSVPLRCPSGDPRGCQGVVRLVVPGTRLALEDTYTLGPGGRRRIRLPIDPRVARAVHRRARLRLTAWSPSSDTYGAPRFVTARVVVVR